MFRKMFMGIALLALGSYLWMGTSVGSYVRTGYAQAKGFVMGQVPVEFEIERAKNLVARLKPETEKARRTIVREEVQLTRLRSDIAERQKNLEGEKVAILSLRDHLQKAKGLTSYAINNEHYTPDAIEKELNRRFSVYKHVDEVIQSKKQILSSRESALLSAKGKHDQLLASQQDLESKLAALEARQKMIEVKKMSSNLVIDDSQLSQARQLMDEINDRLEVESKVAEEDGVLLKQIPLDKSNVSDVGKEVDSYFGKKAPSGPSL